MGLGPGGSLSGGSLSLGTVGGPRGVGAGTIRALLQFVTQYDRGQLQRLESDLTGLRAQQVQTQRDIQTQLAKRIQLEQQIHQAQQAQVLLGTQSRENLANYTKLQKEATAQLQINGQVRAQTAADLVAAQAKFVADAVAANELTRQQANNLLAASGYASRLVQIQEQLNALGQADIGIQGEIADKLKQQQTISQRAGQLKNQVSGLLLGAVGGVVGGALVGGLLFGPLQAALDGVADFANDVIDPAHKARDAVKDLGDAINGMVSPEFPTRAAAAQKFIEGLSAPAKGVVTAGPLATAAQVADSQKALDQVKSYNEQLAHSKDLVAEQVKNWAETFIKTDQIKGTLKTVVQTQSEFHAGINEFVQTLADGKVEAIDMAYYLGRGKDAVDAFDPTKVDSVADAAANAAANAEALVSALREIADQQIDAHLSIVTDQISSWSDIAVGRLKDSASRDIQDIQDRYGVAIDQARSGADSQINALQRRSQSLGGPSSRTTNLQKMLEALNDAGPSRRTKELADQLERINKADEKAKYLADLATATENIRLERLRQRLELTQKDIDLSKFHGQARVIAIQAEIDLMNRRNERQANFNKLLDIQAAIAKGVQRASGESIQDFLSRRGQFYRDQLLQAQQLNTKTVEDSLNAEKTRVENELSLRALVERRKKIIEDRAHQLYLRRIQNELDASKKADQDALDARRKQLQAELKASQEADQAALESARQAIQKRIDSIRAATDDHIKQIERERDAAIEARQKQLDFDLEKEKQATENALEQAKQRAADAKQWADAATAAQKIAAIAAAQNATDIGAIGGRAAGSAFAYEQLKAELEASGLSGTELTNALANIAKVRQAAANALAGLRDPRNNDAFTPGRAKGGFFPLTNAMNFGKNMRVGEEGDEIGWSNGRFGAVLPHKIAEAMKGSMGGGLDMGGITINGSEDPYRDAWRFRREVRGIVRDELSRQ